MRLPPIGNVAPISGRPPAWFAWSAASWACRHVLGARGACDLGSCDRLQDHQEAAGIVFEDTASALFGVEGLRVTDVQAGSDGALEVWAVTDYPAAAACPECGTVSDRVHETVLTRPRDVRRAADRVDLHWVKVRRKCGNQENARARRSPSRCLPCRRGAGSGPGCGGRPAPKWPSGKPPWRRRPGHTGVLLTGGAGGVRRRGGSAAGPARGPGGAPGHRRAPPRLGPVRRR